MNSLYLTEKTNHYWEVRPSKSCSTGQAHQGEVPLGHHKPLMGMDWRDMHMNYVSCIWLFLRVSGGGSWKVHIARPGGVNHPYQSNMVHTSGDLCPFLCSWKLLDLKWGALVPPAFSSVGWAFSFSFPFYQIFAFTAAFLYFFQLFIWDKKSPDLQ